MTEQQDIEIQTYTKTFEKVCQETLESRNSTPEHIIDLATRVHRVNGLRAIVREARQNKFQQTAEKVSTLQKKIAVFHALVHRTNGVA